MTKSLKWRLTKLPTPSELTELVQSKIISAEEAKEILLSQEDTTEREADSFKEEIKFLRELVEKLSDGKKEKVVEYIHTYQYNYPWFVPYQQWVPQVYYSNGGAGRLYTTGSGTTGATCGSTNIVGASVSSGGQECSFSSISTF